MDLDDFTHVTATRLLWREQVAALPRSLWHGLRRLLRREPRWYLTIDGRVVARFVASEDHLAHLEWLGDAHARAFDYAFALGREHVVAQHLSARQYASVIEYIQAAYGDTKPAGTS